MLFYSCGRRRTGGFDEYILVEHAERKKWKGTGDHENKP